MLLGVCTGYKRVCVCVSFQASKSLVFHWGKSTLSISCHVWLPSVVPDNTESRNSQLAHYLTFSQWYDGCQACHFALTNHKCFTGRNSAKECAKRHRLCFFFQVQILFLPTVWKCQTFCHCQKEASGTFRELKSDTSTDLCEIFYSGKHFSLIMKTQ